MLDNAIADEVFHTLLDQGSLSKATILQQWDLDENGFRELQRLLLCNSQVQKGPQRIGGFVVAKRRRGASANESESRGLQLASAWQRDAASRLATLLQHSEIEELLGDLRQAVRQTEKMMTGEDRRGSKLELAGALIVRHGMDLFAEQEIRVLVGKRCGVIAPDRWHPGKSKATSFVRQCVFPDEMAGIPAEATRPSHEYLEGRVEICPLEDFQDEVKRALATILGIPGQRAIVTLPTGAGKTRVAVECLRERMSYLWRARGDGGCAPVVLWLAHTEELCEQAFACFKQVWDGSEDVCPLHLVRFWSDYSDELIEDADQFGRMLRTPSVFISTPNRIVGLLTPDEQGRVSATATAMGNAIGILIIDEAHRAAAPSYRHIIDSWCPEGSRASVVGLTATPFRMEYCSSDPNEGTLELREIFRDLIEPRNTLGTNPRKVLQDRGVLARPLFHAIKTSTRLRVPPGSTNGPFDSSEVERIDKALALSADRSQRRLEIFQAILPIAKDEANSILYFGPSVRDAECMAFLLLLHGVPAEVVSGSTRDVTRRRIVHDFKQQKLRVLCNCEVLTTGFDAPRVTHVVIARPTVSRVLYEQIVGRGLRGERFGGTSECVIMDCEDGLAGSSFVLGYQAFRHIWSRDMEGNDTHGGDSVVDA